MMSGRGDLFSFCSDEQALLARYGGRVMCEVKSVHGGSVMRIVLMLNVSGWPVVTSVW